MKCLDSFQSRLDVPSLKGCGRSSELSIGRGEMTFESSVYLLSGIRPSGMDLSIVNRGVLEFDG